MLYRLRFLSEQAPLDAASFSYVFPLMQRVVEREAITDDGDEAAIREQSTEQLTLALDALTFHAASLSDRAYPRIGVISLLIEMVRKQSSLRRGAAETLIAVGETIAASAEAEEELTGIEPFPLAYEIATLLSGTLSAEAYARQACLNALVPFDLTELRGGTAPEGGLDASVTGAQFPASFEGTTATHAGANSQVIASPFDASLVGDNWSPALWLACHDVEDEKNVDLARGIWEDNGLDVPELGEAWVRVHVGFLGMYYSSICYYTASYVRKSAAVALADAVSLKPGPTNTNAVETLAVLKEYYREKARILAPEFDQYGMVIASSLDRADPWPAREAVGLAFAHLAPHFPLDEVEPFFGFLISGAGHAAKDDREGDPPLGDREAAVRRAMLDAGVAVIDIHGGDAKILPPLIAMFEAQLAAGSGGTPAGDYIQESVVVLFGRLARHLDASDARIPTVVDKLVDALSTPAEQVQIAVSECLAPLVAGMEESKVTSLIDRLFDNLFNAPKYAVRRGAAYGLAGAVRGAGIGAMKKYQIMERIKAATEDKKRYEPRQGAMFATETLATTLGRLFEPYITLVLPLLLTEFGDAVPDVREATQDAAKVIMSRLSGYGVKLILPTLLEGLEEKQWRTKKGSIELLGMMAYCSPRQLSLSLPIIIPRLTEVLTDSHAQVRSAANKSLKMFGEVISNPEIQSLVPVLLKALVDPAKTPNALTGLLKTSFMHYIDHSSLALVIPIVERGLKERGAETKRKAAQIVGNLASLTDTKDFVPYLSALLPLVHVVLADPVPEARATAAKALGTLVERLGESYFPDLVPGLLRTLKTDTSGVDRQGAAQGLSEVLSGLGMERMEGLLPDVIANAQSPRATVREGFMSLLVYLPATFGMRFQPHLPRIIAPILSGLADTEDYVRDAAMRAGRMVVTNYANRAIDLLLPELEQGMFDPGWRIRQSSITLVGELLFKVSGISGKTSDFDEDDTGEVEANVAESSRKALVEVLGQERRDRILSALYIVRQDSVLVVRTSSIQIWKALVHNTPRTVRELLPELVSQLIVLISSSEFDQQDVANRTVAETCRKFGERFVGEMLAILRSKVQSTDARTREGVNLVLCETMLNSSEAQREGHEDEIITMVRMSLVDDEANVRAAAAKAFDVLQEQMGAKAIDETIPTLLEALRQPGKGSGTALQALREVMNVRAATVFPVLIPTLTAIPMTVFNARALAALVTVAGNALSKRLTVIIQALVRVLEETQDDELREAVDEALRALLSSINDLEGLNTVMMVLLDWAKAPAPRRRVSGYECFAMFCDVSELDASLYRVDWIRQLVSGLEEPDVQIHTAAWKALDTFVKSLPKDELEPLVVPLRRSIESTGTPEHHVPGFSLPKGVAPLVPIIIAGLTTGSNEQREAAAYAIGDLVERTAPDAIKPFVVPFTGPLIRVATQATAYPPGVKVAILTALMVMLQRIPVFVKPFFPQLQRTFVKSAGDPSSVAVRTRAAKALGALMKHQPRVDPVVTELIAGVKASDDPIGASLVLALAETVKSAGPSVGDKMREAIVELVSDALRDTHDDHFAQAIGAVLRAGSLHFPEAFRDVVETYLVSDTPQTLMSSHVILTVVEEDEEDESTHGQLNLFQKLGLLLGVAQKAIESAGNERPAIARPARLARDIIKEIDDESLSGLF
ncbi:ARM repeat-containing protein [Schizophyllum commune H4-8]|uniref:ARM repeat-containing protein n=1 Tax=Schizophyllum commune (strain H4-8 / FGSC 9210) TaxID=578458 RepID=UPI0021610A36|nr:ARM repeat-containing protein [Schizophyllum commune H4-8]KAI5891871.1 ARM repeat-containing protein [Schizophyllum commune H4-8]